MSYIGHGLLVDLLELDIKIFVIPLPNMRNFQEKEIVKNIFYHRHSSLSCDFVSSIFAPLNLEFFKSMKALWCSVLPTSKFSNWIKSITTPKTKSNPGAPLPKKQRAIRGHNFSSVSLLKSAWKRDTATRNARWWRGSEDGDDDKDDNYRVAWNLARCAGTVAAHAWAHQWAPDLPCNYNPPFYFRGRCEIRGKRLCSLEVAQNRENRY